MKSFSIRKIANPNQKNGAASAASQWGDEQKFGMHGQGGNQAAGVAQAHQAQQPSLLTEEEQEALKPKEVTVENPWIYEQTHQEYLDNIKVSKQQAFAPHLIRNFFNLGLASSSCKRNQKASRRAEGKDLLA